MVRRRPQIVLSATSLPDQVGLFRGLGRWLNRDPDLSVYAYPALTAAQVRNLPCDGLITDAGARMEELSPKAGFPLVEIADRPNAQNPYLVAFDDHAVGRLAADHFLEQGYWQFACVMYGPSVFWGVQREQGFAERLGEVGYSHAPVYVHDLPLDPRAPDVLSNYDTSRQRAVAKFLRALPKPLAVFAGDDALALMVADACKRARLNIPADVALLGVNNGPECEMSSPRLSSIALPSELLGYEAIGLIAALLKGSRDVRRRTLLPPLAVVVRASSDALQVRDPVVAKALRYIRDHPRGAVGVKELAAHVGLSRRSLELRFREAVGRTPGEEVQRLRIALWRRLLTDTDLPIAEIAQRCGFGTSAAFATAVQRTEGVTPSAYRALAANPSNAISQAHTPPQGIR